MRPSFTFRGGARESVQISEADANGLLVQQGLSLQRVDWDQILRIEGLSSTSQHQAAIDAWLPHAELLWRFRSRLERLDFQGPLGWLQRSTSGKTIPAELVACA